MKLLISLCFVALLLMAYPHGSEACVGRILTIGTLGSSDEQFLAELVSVLLSERTGTNVKVVPFQHSKDLYQAVHKGEVGLVIENVERGMAVAGKTGDYRLKTAYDAVKKEYRKNLNLVWLEPFGESRQYAPVVSVEILANLPALPKLVGKLAAIINDETFAKLVKSSKPDGRYQKTAREFLKSKKLI